MNCELLILIWEEEDGKFKTKEATKRNEKKYI